MITLNHIVYPDIAYSQVEGGIDIRERNVIHTITAMLVFNGSPVVPEETATAAFVFQKPDGTKSSYMAVLENGIVKAPLTLGVVDQHGEVKCQFEVYDNGVKQFSTPVFRLLIGEDLYDEEAMEEIVSDPTVYEQIVGSFGEWQAYMEALQAAVERGDFNGADGQDGAPGPAGPPGPAADLTDYATKEYVEGKGYQNGSQVTAIVRSEIEDRIVYGIDYAYILNKPTVDSTPTANSTNLVTSGGVKAYVDAAVADVDVDLTDYYTKDEVTKQIQDRTVYINKPVEETVKTTSGGINTYTWEQVFASDWVYTLAVINHIVFENNGDTCRMTTVGTNPDYALVYKFPDESSMTPTGTPCFRLRWSESGGVSYLHLDTDQELDGAIVFWRDNQPIRWDALYLPDGKSRVFQEILTFDNVPTADSDNPVKSGGVYSSIAEVMQVANGKCACYVFSTVADMNTWLGVAANVAKLHTGDVFLIRDINVPDYWWDGSTTPGTTQILETTKVDLNGYVQAGDNVSDLVNDAGYQNGSQVTAIVRSEIEDRIVYGIDHAYILNVPTLNSANAAATYGFRIVTANSAPTNAPSNLITIVV